LERKGIIASPTVHETKPIAAAQARIRTRLAASAEIDLCQRFQAQRNYTSRTLANGQKARVLLSDEKKGDL
jgi:hypothetical protein